MLSEEDEKVLDGLRLLAFSRIMAGTSVATAAFMQSASPKVIEEVCRTWLSKNPPQIVFFCRLMASAHRLCEVGEFDQARTQVILDTMTEQVPIVAAFLRRMPEITDMIENAMADDQQLMHITHLLSHFLPQN